MAGAIDIKRVTVSSAGTPVKVSSNSDLTAAFTIIGDPNNTGKLWVGDSAVDAASSLGIPVAPSDSAEFEGRETSGVIESLDLSLFEIDADNDGDTAIVVIYRGEL